MMSSPSDGMMSVVSVVFLFGYCKCMNILIEDVGHCILSALIKNLENVRLLCCVSPLKTKVMSFYQLWSHVMLGIQLKRSLYIMLYTKRISIGISIVKLL